VKKVKIRYSFNGHGEQDPEQSEGLVFPVPRAAARLNLRGFLVAGLLISLSLFLSCTRKDEEAPERVQPTAYGSAILEVSGMNQVASTGSLLDEPLVVEVDDEEEEPVVGALVTFAGPAGVTFTPASVLTDSYGEASTNCALGGVAGRYQLIAYTADKSGKRVELQYEAIALGYEQVLGRQINEQYCSRCHNPESTAERVSNYANLNTKPYPFDDGEALNELSDDDITAIITRGGAAVGRSQEMPPWGYTLSESDIQAVVSFIRAISSPAYPVFSGHLDEALLK